MSVSNLFVPNNETIFCKRLVTDDLDLETLEIDNVIVKNATVLTQITTPNITSGTSLFNTVDTISLNAINGTIQNLNVPGSLTAASFNPSTINTNSLTVTGTSTLNNVVASGNITANSINSSTSVASTLTSTVGVIGVLGTSALTLGTLGPTSSTPLSFYYYDTANVAITGGAVGTTTFFRGIRIGNAVTLQIGLPGALVAASNILPINIAIPLPFRNPTSCRGTCLMLKGASTIQATWATGVAAIQIYAGLQLSNFWNIGEFCSFSEGGTWSFDWVV